MTFKVIGFQPITLVFRFPPPCWVSQSVSLCVWNISQFSCGPWENAWSRCTHWMLCKTRIPKFITFPPASVLFFFFFFCHFFSICSPVSDQWAASGEDRAEEHHSGVEKTLLPQQQPHRIWSQVLWEGEFHCYIIICLCCHHSLRPTTQSFFYINLYEFFKTSQKFIKVQMPGGYEMGFIVPVKSVTH